MSSNSSVGIATTTDGKVQILVAEGESLLSVELSPAGARRVAIKILEAIGEAEWIASKNGARQ